MLLNFQYHPAAEPNQNIPIVLIHGLFGSLSNLGILARALNDQYDIVQIDVRNHGLSAHTNEMNYAVMAQDVIETLDHLNIENFSAIGHSMGGKLAMTLTEVAPSRLQQLVILDMAPFAYQENHHDQIFKALFAVKSANIESRKQATEIMAQYLQENMVIQFLLKSFNKGQWLFNVDALYQHYADILSWDNLQVWSKSTLVIRGENSPYVAQPDKVEAIHQQFSNVEIKIVENAGHWLHAEQSEQVITLIKAYLHSI